MRLLVIGGSGLVGSHLVEAAVADGHHVTGTYRTHALPGLIPLDLVDEAAVAASLDAQRPDWVVHSAGWTWVDGCERDPARAMRENCEQPARLAALCHGRGIRFAYVSTTYVFDGTAGPYREDDIPNPINVYARSKLEGERRVQAACAGAALIPRVICVWGREAQQKNFVYQVLKARREGRTMTLPSDQIGNPTWAGDIACWLLELMVAGEAGIWNLAGEQENCTRVKWFCAIRDAARAAGLVPQDDRAGYVGCTTKELAQPALRPLHAGARIDKILARFPRQSAAPGEVLRLGEVALFPLPNLANR